jgi:hypothetical protein
MKTTLWRVVLPYGVFGLITDHKGKVIKSAPMGKWTIGKHISDVKYYYETKKKGFVQEVA